ncbi:MAG: FAD-dependent monooxygenase [Burkholderiales bacterium]|nr:FAD-dependent monooxygenase [Burkholderiales bacterium]
MATPVQMGGYTLPEYAFVAPPELGAPGVKRHRLVILGAGLAGLALACDLAERGVESVLIDEDNTVGVRGASSRGIVYAQKTLELMDRMGVWPAIEKKGVVWSVGKTLAGDEVVYEFDASVKSESRQPPFVNLQQFYLEWFMVDRIVELGLTDLRWKSKVVGYTPLADGARIDIETPAGNYAIEADWVCDCTGVNSFVRETLKQDTHQARGIDRWCISDVRFKEKLPIERWTWVEAPFNDNRAVWQHLMADDVWRMDFQMGPETDIEYVSRPEVAAERVRRQLGEDVEFELVWVGPYSYRAQLLDHFRVGRTFFLGDSAHAVSPFGARGGNTGMQDAENLGWKLALYFAGQAPEALLDTYQTERHAAAQFNLMTTRRTARFLQPESPAEKILRDAVLSLAREYPFARSLCNTGRLSSSYLYGKPPTSAVQRHRVHAVDPGEAVQNVPLTLPDGRAGTLTDLFRGASAFVAVWHGVPADARDALVRLANRRAPHLRMVEAGGGASGLSVVRDSQGALARVLGLGRTASGPQCCLIRPDLHLAARIDAATPAKLAAAYAQALKGKP